MSSFGELFATEELRDYLKEQYPALKFDSIEHSLYDCYAAADLPNKFTVKLLNKDDKVVAEVEVEPHFCIEEGLQGKYIDAELVDGTVRILKKGGV